MTVSPIASVLRDAWDQESVWSQAASRLKRSVARTRSATLGLTILSAVLSTAAAVVGLGEPGGKWLVFGASAAAGLAAVGHVLAVGKAVQPWTRARSVSEAIKSEVYTYLTCAGDYALDGRDDVLEARVAAFEKDAADLLPSDITPKPRETPAVNDAGSFARLRVTAQVDEYYKPNAADLDRKIKAARGVEIGLAITGALIAAAAGTWEIDDLAIWVPVVTTVSAAIAAHAAAERYEFLRLEYSRTARELEHLLSRWKRSRLSDDEFVMQCESVISVQNEAWMAKLTEE